MEAIDYLMADYERYLNTHTFDIHLRRSPSNWIQIYTEDLEVSIQNRRSYCDRGRYLIVAANRDIMFQAIDNQDAFPRYYYDFDCMMKELDFFLKAKCQSIIDVYERGLNDI